MSLPPLLPLLRRVSLRTAGTELHASINNAELHLVDQTAITTLQKILRHARLNPPREAPRSNCFLFSDFGDHSAQINVARASPQNMIHIRISAADIGCSVGWGVSLLHPKRDAPVAMHF